LFFKFFLLFICLRVKNILIYVGNFGFHTVLFDLQAMGLLCVPFTLKYRLLLRLLKHG
jgi:hypothetical protein